MTEIIVDEYAAKVIDSVISALQLDLCLEGQSYINGDKADHRVVKVAGLNFGHLVGSQESKLPYEVYGERFC